MPLSKRRRTSRCDGDARASPSNGVLHEVKDAIRKETETLQQVKQAVQRPWWRTGRFLFPLGMLIGTLLGFTFVEPQDLHDFHAQLSILMTEYGVDFPQLPDFDFSRVEVEWQRLRNSIPEVWKFNNDGREFKVGEAMKAKNLSAEYPVVLIPGIISTGLESWSTSPDYRAFFREKLWGGFNMISQVTFNKEKWIAAMMLDPITGLDPPDAKIRAAEGMNAASTFIQGYWIWSKIIENLAVVNYDTNNLHLAPYDWRLSYFNLEERDGYFSRLKSVIELFKWRQKRKVVVAAHSMGATVSSTLAFRVHFDSHLRFSCGLKHHNMVVPKTIAAFLSGEMKDTVQMNPAGAYVLERFFSRKERQKLFRSWAGSASMWLKGGDAVWGNEIQAPDDEYNTTHSHGELIAFRRNPIENDDEVPSKNMTADETSDWILKHMPSSFQKMVATNYSFGIERDERELEKNNHDHRKWSNPLEVQLPKAPSMKIYCVYGVGKDTERSYWYTRGDFERDEALADGLDQECHEPSTDGCKIARSNPLDFSLFRKSLIDVEYSNGDGNPKVFNGVRIGEGDGTVSVLSLGAMCVEGWKRKRWNPAGIKVTTVELPHKPNPMIPRGGANTSDHVDILGSTGLNEIVLQVATGVGHEIRDNYVSDIRRYANKVQWDAGT
ncbi:hypothetical protein AGABI1DRAFT_71227 [Agaricus bisporus var. burnettii JB137-S8]|uniref:Phospholipid:diacylglycerol acyltransferase n=1 Tax=Agaricus bisporus var. burnettii (strain JB137-S8 / ATCC MYA-4627 / FGSC 10392) TaxID=597362 RepID=K5XBR1_AGABU|nr:uncharacterized protein AGABI1DRAFT_71227 [Agaricus bisporus var. burnettii JB137-S8]EKM80728.1 hypothetical protein AGABI1DRAFT_71227 [Agaricus bisporus var. burnettii JB137-S8]